MGHSYKKLRFFLFTHSFVGQLFAIEAYRKFVKGDSKVKRDIFMGLGLHPTVEEEMLSFDSPKYLFEIEKIKRDIDESGVMVAPINQLDLVGQMRPKFESILTVLRGWELRPACEIMHL